MEEVNNKPAGDAESRAVSLERELADLKKENAMLRAAIPFNFVDVNDAVTLGRDTVLFDNSKKEFVGNVNGRSVSLSAFFRHFPDTHPYLLHRDNGKPRTPKQKADFIARFGLEAFEKSLRSI